MRSLRDCKSDGVAVDPAEAGIDIYLIAHSGSRTDGTGPAPVGQGKLGRVGIDPRHRRGDVLRGTASREGRVRRKCHGVVRRGIRG